MTYNKSLQVRFVSGRLTPVWLFTASLLLWVVRVVADAFLGAEMTFAGYFVPLLLSLLCYVAATVILDVSFLFERRVRWLSAMFMWLAAVSSSVSYFSYVILQVRSHEITHTIIFSNLLKSAIRLKRNLKEFGMKTLYDSHMNG